MWQTEVEEKCRYCGWSNKNSSGKCKICGTPLSLFSNTEDLLISEDSDKQKPEAENKKKLKTNSVPASIDYLNRILQRSYFRNRKQVLKSRLPKAESSLPKNKSSKVKKLVAKIDWNNFYALFKLPPLPDISRKGKIIGLSVFAFGAIVLGNQLIVTSDSDVSPPAGLFDYGGAPFFISFTNELNAQIEKKHDHFRLRYAKPVGDFSTSASVKALIDKDLSFIYNDRSLSDAEYEQARLRNLEIVQYPIAIDGVVVYGNTKIKQNKLNLDTLIKIYEGDITNWKQVDPKNGDLPITPIAIFNEDYPLPNYNKEAKHILKEDNYYQAVREVIRTPGAISIASAALVKDRKLIRVFDLSQGNTTNYIKPFLKDRINSEAFRSGAYPFTRKLFLVIRDDSTIQEEAGRAYLDLLTSSKGQEIIENAGFISIYE